MLQGAYRRIKDAYSSEHLKEVIKGSLYAFVLRFVSAALAFAFSVAVGRILGAEGAGQYFLVLSIVSIASVVTRFGLDNAMLRFVASNVAKGDWGKVKGVYRLGMRIAAMGSILLSLILLPSSPWIATELLEKDELVLPLQLMCLSIFPFVMLNLQAESLKGLKRINNGMIVQGVAIPLIGLVILHPMATYYGLVGVVLSYVLPVIAVAGVGAVLWRKGINEVALPGRVEFDIKELIESCKPMWLVAIMNRAVLPWLPLLLLGIWATSEDAGVFGAATRIAMLVSFMLTVVNNVLAPKFAELYAKNDMRTLESVARHSAAVVALVSTPVFIVMIFYGDWVMSLYGSEFTRGGSVLAVLAIGQLINVFTGSVGFVLMMGGREVDAWVSLVYSTLVLVSTCMLLMPTYGIWGGAIALLLAELVKNMMLVVLCKKNMGIMAVPFIRVRSDA